MQIPIQDGLFREDSGQPRLLASHCSACGETFFPRRNICVNCNGNHIEEITLDGEGHIYTYTIVRHKPQEYIGSVPYIFAQIELPEGLRINGTLTACDDPQIGMRVKLVLKSVGQDEKGNDIFMFMFQPMNNHESVT